MDKITNYNLAIKEVKESPFDVFDHLDESFRHNKKFVLEAVSIYGFIFQYLDDDFRSDKEILLRAISKDPSCIEYASEDLRKDKEIALKCVTNQWYTLEYIDESLKKDEDIILTAIASKLLDSVESLKFADISLRNNKAFMKKAINIHPLVIKYASDELKDDQELAEELLFKSKFLIKYLILLYL